MKKQFNTYTYFFSIIILCIIGGKYLWQHPPNLLFLKIQQIESKLPTSSSKTMIGSSASQKPLKYTGQKQFILAELDDLGRAVDAHIQLKASDEPGHNGEKRSERLTYNPVGWHNYKLNYQEGNKTGKTWLFDRGHLVGYQFSGVNDEPKNLVPETSQLNKGNVAHMDNSNTNSMLFYEQGLDSWLELHPNYSLDYQVTPIYEKDELIPRQVRLAYIGIDSNGEYLPIELGGNREMNGNDATVVILDNISDNAEINYALGTAKQK